MTYEYEYYTQKLLVYNVDGKLANNLCCSVSDISTLCWKMAFTSEGEGSKVSQMVTYVGFGRERRCANIFIKNMLFIFIFGKLFWIARKDSIDILLN